MGKIRCEHEINKLFVDGVDGTGAGPLSGEPIQDAAFVEYTKTFEAADFLVGEILFEADEAFTADFFVVGGELTDDHAVVTTVRGTGKLGPLDACNDVLLTILVVGELLQSLPAHGAIVRVVDVGVACRRICLDECLVVLASPSTATRRRRRPVAVAVATASILAATEGGPQHLKLLHAHVARAVRDVRRL